MAIEHYQRYQMACQMAQGRTVLDAACGEGYGSSLLAQYAEKVVGLDIDKAAVSEASQKYKSEKLSFVSGSIAALPFEDFSFDLVVSYETIEHVPEEIQSLFLNEIQRVLRPEGILIMSTPNKAVYTDKVSGYNQFHIKEFYTDEYVSFLHRYFSDIKAFCQFPDVGYFVAQEGEEIPVVHRGCANDRSRYIIAICSNIKKDYKIRLEQLTRFNDDMYYGLYSNIHHLESSLLETKKEADTFQQSLERDINNQKKYIAHLENDIAVQNEELTRLNMDKENQAQYIRHLEKEADESKRYALHVEHDLNEQTEYIRHLEKDISELKRYSLHLEHDLKEQAEYICHLEKDAEALRKTGEEQDV